MESYQRVITTVIVLVASDIQAEYRGVEDPGIEPRKKQRGGARYVLHVHQKMRLYRYPEIPYLTTLFVTAPG